MAESSERRDLADEVSRLASRAAIDPTANVLEHVRSAIRRIDDLQTAETRHNREIGALRAAHQEFVAALRAGHAKELAAAEKERLDAIRSIDAQAIGLADAKLNNLGERLQQQIAGTATLMSDRIASVERTQYQGLGEKAQQKEGRADTQWVVGLLTGGGIALAGIAVSLAIAIQ